MFSLSSEILIDESAIHDRIRMMAEEMKNDLLSKSPLLVVGMLRGCFVFMADLLRELARHGIDIDEVDFIIASSYG